MLQGTVKHTNSLISSLDSAASRPAQMLRLFAICAVATAADMQPLDAEGLRALMGSPRPAFALFHPEGCAAACQTLHTMWEGVSTSMAQVGIRFGVVECATFPDVCAARKVGAATQPVLKFWTGSTFRRYAGKLNQQAVEDYASKKISKLAEEAQQQQGQQRRQNPYKPTSPPRLPLRHHILYALGSGLFGAWLLIRWLSLSTEEQPGFMILVGTRKPVPGRAAEAAGIQGADDGLYVFRSEPSSGELTPIAHMPVGARNLASMCAQWRGRGNGGYNVHLACGEGDEAGFEGGVASLRFDAQCSTCVQVVASCCILVHAPTSDLA